jgi:hypothetical protein
MYLPDLRPIFWLAGFGLVCAVLAIIVGIPAGAWYLFHHLAWR